MIRIEEFCKKFNLPNLLVQDESKNPYGTWKDRRSKLIIRKAKKEFVNKLCLISSGNAAFSLAKFAEGSAIKVVAVVDVQLPASIKDVLRSVCSKMIETDLSQKILKPEEVIALARESDEEVIWDVTNGFPAAYKSIIEEIKDQAPDYLLCPVGSGEGFVGLYEGIVKFGLDTKLIGVTARSDPSFADKLHTPWTPYTARINSMLDSGHSLLKLEEDEIKSAYAYAKEYMDCEPSSAIVIGALEKLNFKETDRVVVINSGKGLL